MAIDPNSNTPLHDMSVCRRCSQPHPDLRLLGCSCLLHAVSQFVTYNIHVVLVLVCSCPSVFCPRNCLYRNFDGSLKFIGRIHVFVTSNYYLRDFDWLIFGFYSIPSARSHMYVGLCDLTFSVSFLLPGNHDGQSSGCFLRLLLLCLLCYTSQYMTLQ